MTNIAYVTYSPASALTLNPFWQQLPQWGAAYSVGGGSSYGITGGDLSVSLSGGSGNEWGGVTSGTPLAWVVNSSFAVRVDPGAAASSSNAMWAGIQLATAQPQPLTSSDPTSSACYPLLRLAVDQGNLWFGEITGSGTTVYGTTTYDPVNHKYLRLYEDNLATGFWADWSPDGETWTAGWGASPAPASFGPYYLELIAYSTGLIASTANFSNFVFASGLPPAGSHLLTAVGSEVPLSSPGPASGSLSVSVSAVIASNTNQVVAATGNGLPEIIVPFNYGNTQDVIRDSIVDAVRSAAGDYS